MNDEIRGLLYATDNDEEFGLDEVQLMEEIPVDRIPKLINLLDNESKFIAYQAMLILTAWNIEEGFKKASAFIKEQPDKDYEFEPHRIWGADEAYDYIANALYKATFNGRNVDDIIPFYIELLKLYGVKYFDSKFKRRLMKIGKRTELLPFIIKAINSALENERYFQASQLLPVIAKYEKSVINGYIKRFETLVKHDERIQYNLDEVKELL